MTKYVVKVREGVGQIGVNSVQTIGTIESSTLRGARTKAMQLYKNVVWFGGLCSREDLEIYDESGVTLLSTKDGYDQRWY